MGEVEDAPAGGVVDGAGDGRGGAGDADQPHYGRRHALTARAIF
jgi:hypothetical protein